MQPSLLDSSVFAAEESRATKQTGLAFAILLTFSTALTSLSPGIARAHAIVVAAQPAMNSTVAQGELEIRLDFNSQIDRKRSRLSLQRPDGTELVIALAPDGPAGVLAGQAQATLSGSWKLRWQVLSLDGHITRGEVRFSVRELGRAR
jgi:methionine-rich copper-binding protein CopC